VGRITSALATTQISGIIIGDSRFSKIETAAHRFPPAVVSSSTGGLASFAARIPPSLPPSLSLSLSLCSSLLPVVVAPRLKPRKPGNDQLNETSSALMHSPLLAGCLPAGITYRLYDSQNYPQITQFVPMCALPPPSQPPRRAALYTYSRITTRLLATPPFATTARGTLPLPLSSSLSLSLVRSLSNSNAPGRAILAVAARTEVYLARSGRRA